MRKSIISLLCFAALPFAMSDADAAAPAPTTLFYNESTKVVFADVSTRAAEDDVIAIAAADVPGYVAAGATVDASAQPLIDAGNAAPAASDPAAPATDSATAEPTAVAADPVAADPNVDASPAADTLAVASSSAPDASPSVADADQVPVTAASSDAVYEPAPTVSNAPTTGELTAAASVNPTAPVLAEVAVDDAGTPIDQNTGNVVIPADSHSEAKDRFAGLMAKIHQFENDAVADLKEELRAIGVLLHLHSVASSQAEHTGDYKASDLS